MSRFSPVSDRLPRPLALATAGLVWACAATASAAPAPAPGPAPAPTPQSTTEVQAPVGTPVVVVNTTTNIPAAAAVTAAPAPVVVAPVPVATPVAPVATPVASTAPGRLSVDVYPHPVAPPSATEQARLERLAEKSRARGLRIGGWATLGTSYGFSALIGTIAIDTSSSRRMKSYGGWMTVPVAGPFVAALHSRSATGGLVTATLGAVQVAGLAMALVGGHRYRRAKRALAIAAAPTNGGGQVSVAMRF